MVNSGITILPPGLFDNLPNLQQLCVRFRLACHHLEQHAIAEHDVRWHSFFVGEFAAKRAQRFEQGAIVDVQFVGPQRSRSRRTDTAARGRCTTPAGARHALELHRLGEPLLHALAGAAVARRPARFDLFVEVAHECLMTAPTAFDEIEQGLGAGALNGALLGALCYMTYDLTNQATLARWPLHMTLIDVTWGTFATATAAAAAVWAARAFGG
jgi:uncharacterized membrane protein